MNAAPSPEALAATPEWLAFDLQPASDRATLLRLAEEDYRAASFLDERLLASGPERREAGWADLTEAMAAGARRDVQFIFHIGNVGSTLISRLLGELDQVLALREPMLLRAFADRLDPEAPERWSDSEAQARLDTLRALLSRTFRRGQRALVKATSFTSEIAASFVPPGSCSLFLFASPQAYLESILAGQNSKTTLERLSGRRLQRLQRRCPGLAVDLASLSDARKAALGWACEMTALVENAARLPSDAVMWLDFDLFLESPVSQLERIAGHFGIFLDPGAAQALGQGPLMRRYSKALEHEFTPETRREILADARFRHSGAIRDALDWLQAVARSYPALAAAIRQARQGG